MGQQCQIKIQGTIPGPKAAAMLTRQSELESTGILYPSILPLVPRRAFGPWVEDLDGNVFLDFVSMAGAVALSEEEPLYEAFRGQSREIVTALDYPTEARIAFLEELHSACFELLTWDAKFHLTGPAGTTAVEAALKLAQWATRKPTIIFLAGSFHGTTRGAASVTDLGSSGIKSDPKMLRAFRAEFPLSEERSDHCLELIDELIVRSGETVAAVIVEVVQGEGGVRLLPARFLRDLREVLNQRRVDCR